MQQLPVKTDQFSDLTTIPPWVETIGEESVKHLKVKYNTKKN